MLKTLCIIFDRGRHRGKVLERLGHRLGWALAHLQQKLNRQRFTFQAKTKIVTKYHKSNFLSFSHIFPIFAFFFTKLCTKQEAKAAKA